ncbi:hypothetical protein PC120_g20658 [Phytophthora cactorum]|nr:hypothetical protein PC120_g20658 [Phytophthora cactorum]
MPLQRISIEYVILVFCREESLEFAERRAHPRGRWHVRLHAIGEQLRHLAYVKEQTLKVRQNTRAAVREQHMAARAEKIVRIRFPYYFDYTDHRGLFVRFNRFALDKVPQPDRGKIQILLDKSIATQDAMLNRQCEHLLYLRAFIRNRDSAQAFTKLARFVGDMVVEEAGMYACRMCAQPLICEHEIEL